MPPIPPFADLGVPEAMAARLAARGIVEPTPIQAATVAEALAGRDIAGRAPTGSGKTIAFGIPLVARVGRGRPRHPKALVLVPTRELAAQVARELMALAGPKGPRCATFYGGVGFGAQLAALRSGVDIAVACPGRLADLVSRKEIALDEVEFVVVDEADRMADMGFLKEVRRLLDTVRADRQTLLFSATLDGDVDVLITHYQRKPVRVELAAEADAPEVRHLFWRAERPDRLGITAQVINRSWPAIVFCRTKHGADRVARQLRAAGTSAAAIHGDLSQAQRDRALGAFTKGTVQALVATDIAARGIHVDKVAAVIHYDLPADDKDFVHRSGRTGRAGETGTVIALVGADGVTAAKRIQRALGLPSGIDAPDPKAVDAQAPSAAPRVAPEPPKAAAAPARKAHPGRPQSNAGPARGRRRTGRPQPGGDKRFSATRGSRRSAPR